MIQAYRALLWFQSWCFKLLLLLAGFLVISIAPAVQTDLGAWNGGVSQTACNQFCTYNSDSGVPNLNSTLSSVYQVPGGGPVYPAPVFWI